MSSIYTCDVSEANENWILPHRLRSCKGVDVVTTVDGEDDIGVRVILKRLDLASFFRVVVVGRSVEDMRSTKIHK